MGTCQSSRVVGDGASKAVDKATTSPGASTAVPPPAQRWTPLVSSSSVSTPNGTIASRFLRDRDARDNSFALTAHARVERLKHLPIFILDNSVRETTVGAIRGHTLADKYAIMDHVKAVGIKHQIIATFGPTPRVDDLFARELMNPGASARFEGQHLYCFSELRDAVVDGVPSSALPIGLQRAETYGIMNVILEADLTEPTTDWATLGMDAYCALLQERVQWVRSHLRQDSLIFFNIRDLIDAWLDVPDRAQHVLRFLGTMKPPIFGVMFEDPSGVTFHFDMAVIVANTRAVMDAAGWHDAHFLLHVHNGYGIAEAVVLEALAAGCDGVWAGIPRDGAATGHANSLTTLCNLHRLGNEYVQRTFDLPRMRDAAIDITRIATGALPHPMTELYGTRALDIVFDGFMGTSRSVGSLPELFHAPARTRITTMASAQMFRGKLNEMFGPPADGTEWSSTLVDAMIETMFKDLNAGRKEEYDSAVGFFSLFERAGGVATPAMHAAVVADQALEDAHPVLAQLRDLCDTTCELNTGDDAGHAAAAAMPRMQRVMTYEQCYNSLLARYISCYSCDLTRRALRVLDVDGDGFISWPELVLRAKWALKEYPTRCASVDDLVSVIVDMYIMPEIGRALLSSGDAVVRKRRARPRDMHINTASSLPAVAAARVQSPATAVQPTSAARPAFAVAEPVAAADITDTDTVAVQPPEPPQAPRRQRQNGAPPWNSLFSSRRLKQI